MNKTNKQTKRLERCKATPVTNMCSNLFFGQNNSDQKREKRHKQ